jgi:hypothetical protein
LVDSWLMACAPNQAFNATCFLTDKGLAQLPAGSG